MPNSKLRSLPCSAGGDGAAEASRGDVGVFSADAESWRRRSIHAKLAEALDVLGCRDCGLALSAQLELGLDQLQSFLSLGRQLGVASEVRLDSNVFPDLQPPLQIHVHQFAEQRCTVSRVSNARGRITRVAVNERAGGRHGDSSLVEGNRLNGLDCPMF